MCRLMQNADGFARTDTAIDISISAVLSSYFNLNPFIIFSAKLLEDPFG